MQVENIAKNVKGEVILYLDSDSGEYLGKKMLMDPTAADIEAFYQNPTKPENLTLFSDEELGPRVLKGQGLLFERELPDEGKSDLRTWGIVSNVQREADIVRIEKAAVELEREGKEGMAASLRRNADAAREYIAKTNAAVAHLLSGNPLFVSRETFDGKTTIKYGVLHRSSREPGRYQFSQFDKRGPFTHYGPGTMEELMPEILEFGYEPAPGMDMDFSEKSNLLFETIEEVSVGLQDELYARKIPYTVNFSRSSLSRYYTFPLPTGGEYTVRISDHPKNPGTGRWRKVDWFVNAKSPKSIADFGLKLQELLGPALFRGESESTKGSRGPGGEILFEDETEGQAAPENPFRKNKGKFADSLEGGNNLETFLTQVWTALQKDYDPLKKGKKGTVLERRLSSHPFVLGAVYKMGRGQKLSQAERRNILSSVRRNELAFMEVAAETSGNMDLLQEVRAQREAIVGPKDIKAPKMKGYLSMTVAERTALLGAIRDDKVKERIESGEITDDEIMDYIGRLNDDRKKLRVARKAAAESKDQVTGLKEALSSARKESRMAVRQVASELRAMYKLRAERARFVKRILSPLPEKGMTYSYRKMVEYIQQYLKAKKWETEETEAGGHIFTGGVTNPQNMAAKMSKFFKDNPNIEDVLKEKVVNRINDKPLSAWTNTELKELMDIMDSLRAIGIAEYRSKKRVRLAADELQRNAIDAGIREGKYFYPPNMTSSEEEKRLLRDLDKAHLLAFSTVNMDRVSEYFMDRGLKGKINHELLVEEERAHRRRKFMQEERRIKRIVGVMQANKIKPQDLYRKVLVKGAGPGQSDATLSAWQLMFGYAAMKNEYSYSAWVYGNLFDQPERDMNENDALVEMARPRIEAINEAIAHLSKGEVKVAEEILKDGNDEFDRINQAAIDMTEQELQYQENYIHIQRLGIIKKFSLEDPTSRDIVEDLLSRNGISYAGGPAKGHTISRVDISPKKQTQINDDLWNVFLDSVDKQEHLVEYGRYHQKLQSVYLDPSRSKSIREAIKHSMGQHGIDYLEKYIGEIANPISYKDRDYSETLIRKLRGGVSIGYLAWRWVSVVNQLVTSPIPYMAYAPAQMAGAAGELISNPKRFIEEVEGMSVILRHRQIDPIYERIKNMDQEGWEGVIKTIGEKGMLGLAFADRWSVALGWKAVYNKHMSETKDHEASVIYADDITFKSQPSAYGADLSPLFRDNNEWKRIVTQFGTQLNVIWQQLRYDTVLAKRDERYGEMVGIAMATALGGIALGVVRKLRGKDEPQEDPEKWWVDWLYYAMSQGFNAVPLIGGEFAATAKRIMTGEFTWQENDNFPAVASFFSAAERIAKLEGKTGENLALAQRKIFEDVLESTMMYMGLPALAFKEYTAPIVDAIKGTK
jgi:hypothetical protein